MTERYLRQNGAAWDPIPGDASEEDETETLLGNGPALTDDEHELFLDNSPS